MYLWPLGMRKGLRQFVIHTRHLYGYRLELACLEMEKQNNSHFFCCPKWWPNTCFPGKGFRSRSKYIALFDLVRGRQRQFFTNFAATQSASWAAAPLHQQCLSILFWYSWVLFNASFDHTVRTWLSHSSSLAPGFINQSLAVLQLDDSTWYPDTGASAHMTSNPGNLLSSSPYHGNDQISVGNGSLLPITAVGISILHTLSTQFPWNNVLLPLRKIYWLYCSVRRFCLDNDCVIEFSPFGFCVKDRRTRQSLFKCNNPGLLYPFFPTDASVEDPFPLLFYTRFGSSPLVD